MKTLRGAFRHDTCNAWITEVLNAWQNKGKDINNLVIVCDIALCHSRIENVLHETGAALLRLAPYSPPLNPIETVWSALKSFVRSKLRTPQVIGLGVGEQRLQHIEDVVKEGIESLQDQICVRASQPSASFHGHVLALQNLRVGE